MAPDPGAGATLAGAVGCIACHSTDGSSGIGPTWQGLFLSQRTLADGSTVTADDAYLFEAIVNPNSQIVEGYAAGLMAAGLDGLLTQDEINSIVAFIKTL